MERVIVLKNTDTGQALTLPITPGSYPMGAGRGVERLDMAQTGQIALPGLKGLFSGQLEFELPARQYPHMTAGAAAEPQYYIDLLTEWSREAQVCRYIVTGTAEADGTNDVQCKLPLYEYRVLDDVVVERATQNYSRAAEASAQPEAAERYTVERGDSLWAICRRVYGDGSLAYKLATANGIANPNLIYPGQVLTLPDKGTLAGYAATPAPECAGSGDGAKGVELTALEAGVTAALAAAKAPGNAAAQGAGVTAGSAMSRVLGNAAVQDAAKLAARGAIGLR